MKAEHFDTSSDLSGKPGLSESGARDLANARCSLPGGNSLNHLMNVGNSVRQPRVVELKSDGG